MVSVGIIGFGLSGRIFHTPLLLAHGGYKISAIVSSRPVNLPGVKLTSDVNSVFSDPKIDLVVVCAPNSLHYSLTRDALKSGKHVVVEKPFTNRISEAEELITLAKEKNRKLTVFHNRRWDSDFLTVQTLLKSQALGQVTQFESRFDRFRPNVRPERWKEQNLEGSGIWFDLGSHLLDQALQIFGKPDEIFADIQSQRDSSAADDYFNVILKYGAMRVILRSSSMIEGTPRFVISGTRGHFTKFGLDPQEEQLKNGAINLEIFGKEEKGSFGKLTTYENNLPSTTAIESIRGNYLHFYHQFHRSLLDPNLEVPVSANEALEVVRLLNLGIQSSKSGSWVVV